MKGETIDVLKDITQAVSILNNTEKYFDSLTNELSLCDSLDSDYEHFIENTPIEQVDLKALYLAMQDNYNRRRIIKNDMTLRDNYRNLTARLNNSVNREFLIQNMKNVQSKLGIKYHNRILTDKEIKKLMKKERIIEVKRGRGRPRKNEVIENV